jgi:hypothetical protein
VPNNNNSNVSKMVFFLWWVIHENSNISPCKIYDLQKILLKKPKILQHIIPL